MEIKSKLVCPVCKSEEVFTYDSMNHIPWTKLFKCKKCGQSFDLKHWKNIKDKIEYKTYNMVAEGTAILFPGHSFPICEGCSKRTATIFFQKKFYCVECYKQMEV